MFDLSALFQFSLAVIGPVVLLIAFGYLLYKTGLMTDDFVQRSSRLVFNFALPALLFSSISKSDLQALTSSNSILVGITGTLLVVGFLLLIAPFLANKREDRGVVIQGAFRSNMGIIGLAYCTNAYGQEGLVYASIYLGALTIIYNVLSVILLHFYRGSEFSALGIAKSIASNPIILSILVALGVAYTQIQLPNLIINSISYFAQLTLPLALLCTGASLRFSSLSQDATPAMWSITIKCLVYPLVIVLLALYMDISGMALGVIYLMAVCPTAAASYIMVRKIGGNHQLAAHIVAFSTIVSVPITIVGYQALSHWL